MFCYRAESWMSVTVATPAQVMLVVAGEEQVQDQEVQVVWGQEVNIECQVVQLGNPAPSVHLKLNNNTHDQASMTYFPTLKESGTRWTNENILFCLNKYNT